MISSLRALNARRWFVGVTAAVGIGLLGWTVVSVNIDQLADQLRSIRIVLPLVLALAAVRFALQAEGWSLATIDAERPHRGEAFAAVIAGEGAGYFALGPVSREPIKAAFVAHRVDERIGLAAAVTERLVYTAAATALSILGVGILAFRHGHIRWFVAELVTVVTVLSVVKRFHRPRADVLSKPTMLCALKVSIVELRRRAGASTAVILFAALQEFINVIEAYAVLSWLGAAPSLADIVVLEGVSRLVNAAGQFVPGKLGVSEASSAALASALNIGGSYGLTLALARRARSLVWGAIGVMLLAYRTVVLTPASGSREPALGLASIANLSVAESR